MTAKMGDMAKKHEGEKVVAIDDIERALVHQTNQRLGKVEKKMELRLAEIDKK